MLSRFFRLHTIMAQLGNTIAALNDDSQSNYRSLCLIDFAFGTYWQPRALKDSRRLNRLVVAVGAEMQPEEVLVLKGQLLCSLLPARLVQSAAYCMESNNELMKDIMQWTDSLTPPLALIVPGWLDEDNIALEWGIRVPVFNIHLIAWRVKNLYVN